MNIVSSIQEWFAIRNKFHSVGFVPTMGNLHQGHLSLCEKSKSQNDVTLVSIFVNPTQFNDPNDYALYPRTLDSDITLLESCHVDYLFLGNANELYQDEYQIEIHEKNISEKLEGKFRPGHFNGMLTIVLKLLNIIQPKRAYFGEKDFQQLLLIKKMVAALFLPVEIIACPTVRDENGLALSSRNNRLTPEQKILASKIFYALNNFECVNDAKNYLQQFFKVDYVVDEWQRRLAAVWLGDVRLIDNI